ncbi:MAG: hypothetical protein PVF58_12905 [Candidatus Methanofastidiosia archaeon]|jgi:hypothetical protein
MKKERKFHIQRIFLISIFVVAMLAVIAGSTFAEQSESQEGIKISNLFTWAMSDPPNWMTGIIYALLGMMGSLVTIFSLIGGVIPGTTGQTKIKKGEERLEKWHQKLDELFESSSLNAEAIKYIECAANNLRDDIRAEKRYQFRLAAFIYVVLGAFFSILLAQDMLQALVIGAGWTGFIGTIGLKNDYKERKSYKDAFLDMQKLEIEELKEKLENKGASREELEKTPVKSEVYTTILESSLGNKVDLEKDFSFVRAL